MMNQWEEFKQLLEEALKDQYDPNNIPFTLDPSLGLMYQQGRKEILVWVLEMLPDDYVKKLQKQVNDYGWEASARHSQMTGGTM